MSLPQLPTYSLATARASRVFYTKKSRFRLNRRLKKERINKQKMGLGSMVALTIVMKMYRNRYMCVLDYFFVERIRKLLEMHTLQTARTPAGLLAGGLDEGMAV